MPGIVITGLGAGTFAAILAARKINRSVEITVLDEKSYDLMHPCGLPYAVEGVIGSFDDLYHDLHLDKMRVNVLRPFRVDRIDTACKTVFATSKSTGEAVEITYGKLLIGFGSTPFIPPAPGFDTFAGKGVYTISTPEEAEKLKCAAAPGMRAVCLGAGAIGLETAVALKTLGLDVTVVEMLGNVMPRALDPDISALLEGHLKGLGVKVLCGKKIDEARGGDKLESVVIDSEETLADILLIAAGVRANTEIASAAGVQTGRVGIIVNERMETSAPDVYACGDCVQTKSAIDGADFTLQLATTAYRQGTVAGANAAGGGMIYPGVSGAFVSQIGKLEVAAVGYTASFAESAGYKTVFGKLKDFTLYDWFPGGKDITVKVIADAATGRVIGGQAAGLEGAAWRVNVISAAIHSRMTLEQLSEVELTYCPAVSQTYDPLTKAVDLAIRKRGI